VVVTEAEEQRLRALDRRGRVRFIRHEKPGMRVMSFRGEACTFLDQATNLCTIYERRPEGCRRFPTKPYANCLVWPVEEEEALSAAG